MSLYTPPAELMKLTADAGTSLGRVVGELDVSILTPYESDVLFRSFGEIQRLVHTAVALLARGMQKSQAHRPAGNCDVVNDCAKQLGASVGDVSRMIETATKLEALPDVERAARKGKLSGRAAELIAGAAAKHPDAQARLLEAAEQGLVPLQDACLQVRRQGETDLQRARRLHGMRRLRLFPDEEGMLGGVFRLTPEVGSQVKTLIEDTAQRFYRNRPRNNDNRDGDNDAVAETKDHFQADALADLILRSRAFR